MGALKMNMSGRVSGLGIELLNQSNYKISRTCMESYLVGEDLWEVVCGNAIVAPKDTQENVDVLKAWRMKNTKAEFLLKRSISHDLFEYIIGCKSASEIWITLDGLLNKKNMARLQMFENELANTTQGNLSISQFFLKIKNLCSQISLLDPEEPISEARIPKKLMIQNMKKIGVRCFVAETTTVGALASINFEDDWIVDSGCGHHLTGDESKFSKFRKHEGNDAIITADNTIHPVEKEGVIIIGGANEDPITLKSVFHVPSMKKNLFSVANAVDAGNYVLFGPKAL
ncbi:uncharacterized protein LOC143880697 [Tasmannia lanceolata]|uniref:uncharacterized protein LOC143880697 n=1 Tax=Tasmannia lanceolata TaxID=3420 RepID=UPI0040628958